MSQLPIFAPGLPGISTLEAPSAAKPEPVPVPKGRPTHKRMRPTTMTALPTQTLPAPTDKALP